MKVKLVIGDWSGDGHDKSDYLVFEVNKTLSEIRQAYFTSCKTTGLSFHNDGIYTGICCEYEDSTIDEEDQEILSSFGLDFSKYLDENGYFKNHVDSFGALIMDFIKISIPLLVYEEASFKRSEKIEPINGFWNEDLNKSFGYGLFY